MSTKSVEMDETYVIKEFFACGAGHFLTPGFTHWEEGEVCPHAHEDNENPHLYYRKLMVPTRRSEGQGGGDMLEYFAANPGKWGHLPLVEIQSA